MSEKTKVIGATVGTPLSLSKIKEKFSPYIRQQGYEDETGYIYNLEIGKEYKLVCEPLVGDPSDFEKAYISCYIPEEGEAITFSLPSTQADSLTLKILGIEGTIISYECNGELQTFDTSYYFAKPNLPFTLGSCMLQEWSGEFFVRNPDGITCGANGKDGVGISEILCTSATSGAYRIEFTDGSYFDFIVPKGKDGADGKNGIDGKTPYIQDGYWYIDGVNTNVKAQGVDGKDGADADKSEFSEYIASELAKRGQLEPAFANSIDECTDTSKLYVLPDGYIYANVEKTTEGSVTPNFTNRLPYAEDIDTQNPLNGCGYLTQKYLTTSSPFYNAGAANEWVTGYIPYAIDKSIYIKGISSFSASHDRLYFFASDDKTYRTAKAVNGTNISTYYTVEQLDTDYFKFTPISETLQDEKTTGYMRLGFTTGTPTEVIITVNEEITYTTVEGGTVYEWTNTGHAFVPADYEDRIISLETDLVTAKEDIKELQNSTTITPSSETVPQAVVSGASNLVDKVLSRESNRFLRFLICADAHHKNDDELIAKGTKELGQAHGEILKLIGVDFVANLGDITWGSSASDSATCLEEGKMFNKFMLDNIRGQTQIWTEGNHETDLLTASQIHSLIYSHNKGLVQDANHWIDGYGYMDFPYQKVRVICLNTNQGTASNVSGMSDKQVKWFAEVALNMEGKTDWGVITMGHHPLSYNTVSLMRYASETVKAFINGDNFSFTTNDGTKLNIDYSNKNCQYVGHFHGHAHAFSVVKMQRYVSSGVYEEFDAWEICIPNACYTRNNQYLNNTSNPYVTRYSTPTTYNKTDEDGKRTSFNLVTICLDTKKIYADNYGAGVDREISY